MSYMAIQVRASDVTALSMHGATFVGGPDPKGRKDIWEAGFPPEHAQIIISALKSLNLPYKVGQMGSLELTVHNGASW